MISTKIKKEVSELIDGPAGKLEVMMGSEPEKDCKAWGVICHPHPLYGGTMHNKIVTTLAKTFQNLGVCTVRFNFRGVGLSEGTFDQGQGELYDLLAVIDWLLQQKPDRKLWLGGFSFGACIAAKAATQIPVEKLVTVAPPATECGLESLPPIMCQWVLVQGEKDDVVSPKAVLAWAESRNPKPIILRFPDAGHFFHGQLVELRTELEEVLKTI